MAELLRPQAFGPDLMALISALGQLLVPEYLKPRTGMYDTPTIPSKMPAVENDPMATSMFGGLDLIGNLAPMGAAKLATPLAGAAWKGLAEQAGKTAGPKLSLVKSPAESIAPVTNWAEEVPAAFKKSIADVVPAKKSTDWEAELANSPFNPAKKMSDSDFEQQLANLQAALAGPTPGVKPTLAKAATDFPNPNIPPVPADTPVAKKTAWQEAIAKLAASEKYPVDPAMNAYDLEQAKLLIPKNPVPEPERQARMAASPYQTPTFHGTHSPFEGNTVSGGQFFSTTNPKLSEMYAGDEPMFDNYTPQMLPLRLDTSKYHSFDAEGQTWDQVNSTAIREARKKNAPGVEIRNVLDEPQSGSHGDYKEKLPPQTVYITLEPNTIRSDKAQFDPSKFHLNDLLAALGLGLLAPGAMGGSNAGK